MIERLILLITLIGCLTAPSSWSDSSVFSLKDLQARAEKNHLRGDSLYYFYLSSGLVLESQKHYPEAVSVFQQALQVECKENKGLAWLGITSSQWKNGKPKNARDALSEAIKYFKKNPSQRDKNSELFIEYFEYRLNGKKSPKNSEPPPLLGLEQRWDDLKKLVEEKKFGKALTYFNPSGLKSAPISVKIVYDLLSVLVLGRQARELACEAGLKKYPSSPSYSIKLCKMLVTYRDRGSFDQKSLSEAEKLIEKNYPQEKYLLSAAKELQSTASE